MNSKSRLSEALMLNLGVLLLSLGVYFFKIPNGFITGGISGISIILSRLFGTITPSWLIFIINFLLLIVGFVVFGKQFGFKTAYCSTLFSVLLVVFEKLFPLGQPLTDQPFLELAFAILLPAVGSAIMFNYSASSGGTDVIAMIFRKYTSLNIGVALMVTDFLVAFSSCFVFGLKTGMYSVLGLVCRAFIIDSVIENFNLCKNFMIITTEYEKVRDYILKEVQHGVTVVDAVGGFSYEQKKMLITVCRRFEAPRLKSKIREIDPNSFIMVTNSSEIIGKGFRGM